MKCKLLSSLDGSLKLLVKFIRNENGQGITEYAALIAFVAVLCAMAFSANGALRSGIQGAYSATSSQLLNLSSAGGTAGG
jgi:Flp pilus assembly pilin Flp